MKSKPAKEAAETQLADDLWFIEKARARGEITNAEHAALQREAFAAKPTSETGE